MFVDLNVDGALSYIPDAAYAAMVEFEVHALVDDADHHDVDAASDFDRGREDSGGRALKKTLVENRNRRGG